MTALMNILFSLMSAEWTVAPASLSTGRTGLGQVVVVHHAVVVRQVGPDLVVQGADQSVGRVGTEPVVHVAHQETGGLGHHLAIILERDAGVLSDLSVGIVADAVLADVVQDHRERVVWIVVSEHAHQVGWRDVVVLGLRLVVELGG